MTFEIYVLFFILITKTVFTEKKNQKPIIIEHPNNAYGLNLQRVILRCVADGDPTPKIQWYKSGRIVESYKDKPVTSNRHVKGNELLFLHLDTQDEGVYQCNASNIEGWTMSNNASVRIAYLHKNIGGPEAKIASVGETISLECRPPKGVPEPRVLWKFNGQILEANKRIKVMLNGDLRIDKATRSDSGRYNCVAKNFAYERESEAALLTVHQKPQFKVAPSNIEIRVNEAAVLACSVDGDPKPNIVWRRDNDKHIASSRASLLEDRGLRIVRVQLSDAGNYICQASNRAGTIEAVARLSVISAPGFLETPESQEARVGDTIKFVCQISGSPRPTVIWVHNGRHFIADDDEERVQTNKDDNFVVNNKERIRSNKDRTQFNEDSFSQGERVRANRDGSLVITSVKVSDAGKYECRASSYTGTIQSSAVLTVLDSSHDRPPVIDIGPQNQTLRVGLTATFNCQVQQSEDVNIVWLKDSQRVNGISDPRVIQLTSGTLKINLLRASDAGNYTCKAERGRAYSTWSVALRVLEKNDVETAILQTTDDARMFPATPVNVEVVERGDSWVTLRWDTLAHEPGDTAISYYVVEYSPYESRRGWFSVSTFVQSPGKVVHLRANTGYRFLVRSVNDIAIGRPAVVPFVVFTTKTQPYSQLSYNELKTKIELISCDNVRLKSVSTDQVTVVWQVSGPGHALGLLSGFLALYRRVPLGRCLANSKEAFMEHCSLGDHLLQQVEADINNPRSLLNEEGPEHTKAVPVSDWSDRTAAYTIIGDLRPFVCYELYVKPYLTHRKYGRLTGGHSKARTVLTYDSVPSKAPTDLTARWLSNTSVEIAWAPVPLHYVNGILKGYSLHIIGNDTNSTRSIEVSPKSTSVRVQDLILHMPYVVHIAASTCQGEGIRSAGLVLTATPGLITMSPHVFGARSGPESERSGHSPSVAKQPWFIAIMVVGGCLWIMICVFIVVVCRGIYVRGLIYKSGYSNGTKLISLSNSQIPSGSSNCRLIAGDQTLPYTNAYNESSASAHYKDIIILQPLMSTTTTATGTGNESKMDSADLGNNNNNTASINNISNNNNQRRFQDSISSNSTTSKNSTNQQRAVNGMSLSSNNVAPYASASLLQQVIGISTKNNLKKYNYPMNIPTTHRNILMPFSDPTSSSMNQDMSCAHSYPISSMDWAVNQMNKSDKIGPGIMLNLGHVIPPPPEFPPPPAPISPTASNSTYYLQQQLPQHHHLHHPGGGSAEDGTCSYASCPIDVPICGASTAISPLPGYLWSAMHNGLVPVPGYIDYACIPYNMISLARNSETGSIASSFALPPPHDMLSLAQLCDDPYSPDSTGCAVLAQVGLNGVTNEVLSSMMSSHLSNGSNVTVPHSNGSAGSAAIISGGSSRDYNKYDGANRAGQNDGSNSAMEEELDLADVDKSNDDRDDRGRHSYKTTHRDPSVTWQQPQSLSSPNNFVPRASPYFSPAHYPIEEATYDTCPEDHLPLFNGQRNYFRQDFFPSPANNYYPSSHVTNQINSCYDNHHTASAMDQLNSANGLNPFMGCEYQGETPIV